LTLCLVGPGAVFYVKARARELEPAAARMSRRPASKRTSRTCCSDFARSEVEGDVDVLSGITFRRARPDPPLRERLRRP